VVTQVNKIP